MFKLSGLLPCVCRRHLQQRSPSQPMKQSWFGCCLCSSSSSSKPHHTAAAVKAGKGRATIGTPKELAELSITVDLLTKGVDVCACIHSVYTERVLVTAVFQGSMQSWTTGKHSSGLAARKDKLAPHAWEELHVCVGSVHHACTVLQ